MDEIDRAQIATEGFLDEAMTKQRQRRTQVEPVVIEGETCCPDCLEALEMHRREAGICVPCLTIREKKKKTERR